MSTLHREPTVAERVEMLQRRVRTLQQQREHLTTLCRTWAVYFHPIDPWRETTATLLANDLQRASLGDIRRCGDRLASIMDAWLCDSEEAGTA